MSDSHQTGSQSMNESTFFPWSALSEREKGVWSVIFASKCDKPLVAARSADAAVNELRKLELDNLHGMDPEFEAARAGFHWEFDEFAPWYRVAWQLRHGSRRSFKVPTLDEIKEAYARFQQCRCDFS